MSRDIEELTLDEIGSSRFALQTDEASDYSGKCHLLAFIRFIDGYNIIDQFLFIKEMKTNMTGEDIFHLVDTFFTRHRMLWDHCVGIYTDGASRMPGLLKGLVSKVKASQHTVSSTERHS